MAAMTGEETVRLLTRGSDLRPRRKWAAAALFASGAVALLGAVAVLEANKRTTAARLRSSISLAGGWTCMHFEGTNLTMDWCQIGRRDSKYEYQASGSPGFEGCGGCGCCMREFDPNAPVPAPPQSDDLDDEELVAVPDVVFPWQCSYDMANHTNGCGDGPNPQNGNMGCRVLSASGFDGCAGCGCCDLPLIDTNESTAPKFRPAPKTANPWTCHFYEVGQDKEWCQGEPEVGGVRYALADDVGYCDGCTCCAQMIGGNSTYEAPATRPLPMKSKYAPRDIPWECARMDEFPEGVSLDMCMSPKPWRHLNFEYAAHNANIPGFGGCGGCSCCRRLAGPIPGINQSLVQELPEIAVIYLPEVQKDWMRLKKYYLDAFLYLPGADAKIYEWQGVDCSRWPGGRLNKVDEMLPLLKRNPRTTEDVPMWWRRPSNWEITFTRTTGDGHSTAMYPHHCGCSLSHLTLWLDARERGVHPLIVTENDGGVTRFHWSGSGYAEDFGALAVELAKTESTHWDMILFDKCRSGWSGHGGFHINATGLRGDYFAYHYSGGPAGAAMYMVAKSFFDKLDDMIVEEGYTMIDAWRNVMCEKGHLRCFTVCTFCSGS